MGVVVLVQDTGQDRGMGLETSTFQCTIEQIFLCASEEIPCSFAH